MIGVGIPGLGSEDGWGRIKEGDRERIIKGGVQGSRDAVTQFCRHFF